MSILGDYANALYHILDLSSREFVDYDELIYAIEEIKEICEETLPEEEE
jgi:hypothetical protein